jgi:hypothetical protein
MNELHENKLKRLIMQSNRRGMKENDIILGDFAKNNIGKPKIFICGSLAVKVFHVSLKKLLIKLSVL